MGEVRRGIGPSVLDALSRIAVLTVLAGSTACQGKLERDARAGAGDPAAPVSVARPVSTTVTESSDHTGRADAVDSVEVRAQIGGQLQRVAFREGDIVKKGDLLFVIDPRPYEAGLARAKGALERSKADLWLARRDAARADDLLKSKSISEHEWDTQSGALQQLTAAAQIAAADLTTAELNLEYAFVRAPVGGRMGRALVTVGNLVGPTTATPLSTLVSVDPLYVYVDVEEARALRVPRPRGPARANAPAGDGVVVGHVGFAGEDGYPHEAALDFMDNRIDPATGTTKLRLVVPNHDGRLTPGLFARVRLPEDSGRPGLLISDRAVGTDQDRKFVYVADGENKVQYRGVKLGPLHEGLRVVRDGLSPTDRVIVRGLQRVRPGASVQPTVVPMDSVDQPPTAAGSASPGAAQ
jgi:RND family efflux transporter MFP subunit